MVLFLLERKMDFYLLQKSQMKFFIMNRTGRKKCLKREYYSRSFWRIKIGLPVKYDNGIYRFVPRQCRNTVIGALESFLHACSNFVASAD